MHKKIEERIDDLTKRIAATIALEEDLLKVEAILGEEFTCSIWLDYEINLDFAAKSMDDIKVLLRRFAQNGIMLDSFQPSDTNPVWYLKGKNTKIRLRPYWQSEGAEGVTCRLIKVGEITQTYPQYKLVCDGKEVTYENGDSIPGQHEESNVSSVQDEVLPVSNEGTSI